MQNLSERDRHLDITFTGDQPPAEVQQAVLKALSDYPGSWQIHLDLKLVGGWWLLRVSSAGFTKDLLIAPEEQAPGRVVQSLRDSLGGKVPRAKPAPDR